MGKQWKTLFSWAPKSLWTVTAAMKLQDLAPWKKSYDKPVCLVSQLCLTRCYPRDCSPPGRLLCPWRFSQQEYWSGLPCSPPGDLPNPGIKPRSPTMQADSLLLEPPGKSKNTEWVAYPFSRGSSWPRNRTGVSCIAGRFFTSWATREALGLNKKLF